jgi:DNA-binding transcriptional ArsR family regulator
MLEPLAERLDNVFHALADSTRRAMLRRLATDGECSISDLAAPFEMSFVGASKHVRVLEAAGLVNRRVAGRTLLCRIEARPMLEAAEYLKFYEAFWNSMRTPSSTRRRPCSRRMQKQVLPKVRSDRRAEHQSS